MFDASDDRFGDGHLSRGSLIGDVCGVFGNAGGDDAAAVFQNDGVGGSGELPKADTTPKNRDAGIFVTERTDRF